MCLGLHCDCCFLVSTAIKTVLEALCFYCVSTYASVVFGVEFLSVCPAVCLSHACFVAKPKMHYRYFDTT